MRILFLGKRHYTNKDTLTEKFGRIFHLPYQWSQSGNDAILVLFDYRSLGRESTQVDQLLIESMPAANPRTLWRLRSLAKKMAPDVIVASGDCFIGLAGLRLARSIGARFVFDVYDDYTKFGGHRAFLGWDALNFLLRRADLVFYASSALAAQHSVAAPWHLLPNGVDPEIFKPSSILTSRQRLGIDPAAQLVGYFGGMEPDRGIADLIEAVGKMRSDHPGIQLLLCGKPPKSLSLQEPWIDFRGMVPHSEIPYYINACDVVTIPYRRSPFMDMGASCKIAEFMLCHRPVVATETPNFIANFPVQADQMGFALCRAEDPDDLARAIDYQLKNKHVVAAPVEHVWSAIAANALQALQQAVS